MDLKIVEEILTPYLEENNLSLYSLEIIKEYGSTVIQVLLDRKGGLDLDTLSLANQYLSTKLDNYDQNWEEYMLEVSSAGAEKELRSIEEVNEAVESYVNVTMIDGTVIEGLLLSVEDEVLVVRVNLKGRMKKTPVNYSDIKIIRLAVHM